MILKPSTTKPQRYCTHSQVRIEVLLNRMCLSSSPSSFSTKTFSSWQSIFMISTLAPLVVALLVYQMDSFEPAPLPAEVVTMEVLPVPRRNPRMLRGSEKIGVGRLISPEDIDYDPKSGFIYTSCLDGWIRRLSVNISAPFLAVEDLVNTGGRPLGLVLGHNNDVIIADGLKGLLRVTHDGKMELLTDEAEGVKFKIIDAVDIADDGIIYFTDASYKYGLKDFMWDHLEGRPHGRVLSYDPKSKETKVLMKDLYFANGVVVSADQQSVIVCETPLRRCPRIYIQGEKKGTVDMFIEKIPGMPDNIRYDKHGQYWIALSTELSYPWHLAQKYLFVRKVMALIAKYIRTPMTVRNGGVLAVDLEGSPTAYYHDPQVALISSVIKVGDHLYCGSVISPYMLRLNTTQHPALPLQNQLEA